MPTGSIRSLYIVGNSYSATTQATGYQAWPGMLSAVLNFPFVQANNVAVPGSQLLDIPARGKPGLMTQLRRIPGGSKVGALLALWLFPDLAAPMPTAQWIPLYTSGMDMAVPAMGFKMVLMPNLPDITKTILYKQTYSRLQLAALRTTFLNFNAAYNTMINSFRSRYRNTLFATCDTFSLWDGTGTIADGFHPNQDTHRKFSQWFHTAVSNF